MSAPFLPPARAPIPAPAPADPPMTSADFCHDRLGAVRTTRRTRFVLHVAHCARARLVLDDVADGQRTGADAVTGSGRRVPRAVGAGDHTPVDHRLRQHGLLTRRAPHHGRCDRGDCGKTRGRKANGLRLPRQAGPRRRRRGGRLPLRVHPRLHDGHSQRRQQGSCNGSYSRSHGNLHGAGELLPGLDQHRCQADGRSEPQHFTRARRGLSSWRDRGCAVKRTVKTTSGSLVVSSTYTAARAHVRSVCRPCPASSRGRRRPRHRQPAQP